MKDDRTVCFSFDMFYVNSFYVIYGAQSWNDLSALDSARLPFFIIVQVILERVGYIVLNWISLGEGEGIQFFWTSQSCKT